MEAQHIIPDGISRDDVILAMADFDAGIDHRFGTATKYQVFHEGKVYPPKALIGIAARRLVGRILGPDEFAGGLSSRCFKVLKDLGFEIVRKEVLSVPPAVSQRFKNPKREEVRLAAAAEATALIRKTALWTAETFSDLLRQLNTDWARNKVLHNRYGPGLIGSNEKKLLRSIDRLQLWLHRVHLTENLNDEIVRSLYQDYLERKLPNPYLFPTAIFACMAPDRYTLFVKPLLQATGRLVGRVFRRSKDPNAYLEFNYAMRELCEEHEWPMCLADAALFDVQSSDSREEFDGYAEDAIDFLRELRDRTHDPEWHQEQHARYAQVLRDPTRLLVKTIAEKYITKLDPQVAAVPRPISILKKNDFGGDSYYPYYWFAFFDPAAESKTKSVQLFGYLSGEGDLYRYGFGLGRYCAPYLSRLMGALRSAGPRFADYLSSLGDEVVVVHRSKSSKNSLPVRDAAVAIRDRGIDKVFPESEIEDLDLAIEVHPLDQLAGRGPTLAEDMGVLFTKLWPLFQAGRTGAFDWPDTDGPENDTDDGDGDETFESLADLATLTNIPEERLREMEEALLAKGQLVLVGPPGTSKTYLAQRFARYFVQAQPKERAQGRSHVIYMHASWGYEDFFEGLRPKVDVEGLQFERRDGAFLKWIEVAQRIPSPARHVLVLDEINRCDTAAVLGELLQLMEYRGTTVQLLSGRPFVFPRNLHIIGTMNSADRSVGRMDLALRRRFFFFELMPDPDVLAQWLKDRNECGLDAEALRECNQYLERVCGIPPEQQIGHALFMPSSAGGEDIEEDSELSLTPELLRQIVSYSVIPYVRELMMERGRDPRSAVKKIREIFGMYWQDAEDEEEDENTSSD